RYRNVTGVQTCALPISNEIRKPEEMILNNLIGGNVGNLIYAYSIYRNLMTEDVEIIPDKYKIDPNQADYINENYDAYIIPLADRSEERRVGKKCRNIWM